MNPKRNLELTFEQRAAEITEIYQSLIVTKRLICNSPSSLSPMEKLKKTAYLVGIGIAVSVFTLFMFAFVQIAIDETTPRPGLYDRVSKEVVLAKLQEHPAYVAMYERFPDAAEEFVERRNMASLNVGVMDFDVGNQLVLHLHYEGYDDRVDVEVECRGGSPDLRQLIHGLFAEDFIRVTDCVTGAG